MSAVIIYDQNGVPAIDMDAHRKYCQGLSDTVKREMMGRAFTNMVVRVRAENRSENIKQIAKIAGIAALVCLAILALICAIYFPIVHFMI